MTAAARDTAHVLTCLDTLQETLCKMSNLANAIWFMSRDELPNRPCAADEYRAAVEELAAMQAKATDGVFDALQDVQDFVSAVH